MAGNIIDRFKVSVVIPVYNAERTLKQCLNSVVNQDFKDFEIVVVDNNSTDNSKKIISSFSAGLNVKYVFEKKAGRGAARNAGLRAAVGEIIVLTDADCLVPPDWLRRLSEPIISNQAQAVMGFFAPVMKNFWADNFQESDQQFIHRNLNGHFINGLDTRNFAIKAELIKQFWFDPDLKNFEDFDLFLRLKAKGEKILFLPAVIVGHYHPQNFIQIIKSSFDRGFWLTKIFFKYKKDKEATAHPMFISVSWWNFFSWPGWMMIKFFSLRPDNLWFLLISDLAWRVGIIWFFLTKFRSQLK